MPRGIYKYGMDHHPLFDITIAVYEPRINFTKYFSRGWTFNH